MKYTPYVLTGATLLIGCNQQKKEERPNILWIVLDDTGCDFSCYGNKLIKTPVVDSLAANGILFTQMHVTAPVSSAARSALVTGMYQTSMGAHQHRSSRGKVKIFLDEKKATIPQIFNDNGYYTANVGYDYNAKTDYNFVWNPGMYDTLFRIEEKSWVSPWAFRSSNQPFFIQIQLQGGKNRTVSKRYPVNPALCKSAPYYPDDSLFYFDEASYHSSTLHADKLIGDIMKHLKEDGLIENTVVMILGDNGQDNYHDKQWLYDGGTHVPFIVYGPEKFIGKAARRDDLAIHIDMCASSLAMSGIPVPEYLEGFDLFSKTYQERDHIITARDRCDWTKDRIRAVRSKDFKYVRNYHPESSYMQSQYRDQWPMVIKAKELFAAGKLNAVQAAFFQPIRPAEEFYVLKNDPFETASQIDNPAYKEQVDNMRKHLDEWIKSSGDKGQVEETDESYRESCSNINTYDNKDFPVVSGTTPLLVENGQASFVSYILNNSAKVINVKYSVLPTKGFEAFADEKQLTMKPGEKKEIICKQRIKDTGSDDSLKVMTEVVYEFNKNSTYNYKTLLILKSQSRQIVPETKIAVDGKMGDWLRLPFYSFHDNGVQFGVAQSKEFIYLGIQVFDNNVSVSRDLAPWEQDGIEIRFDARKDPQRSCSDGVEEFADHILLAMSPSVDGAPISMYLPAMINVLMPDGFITKDVKCKCRRNELGYVTEAAIPINYLNDLQDGTWNAFRLNIIVHNANGIGKKRFSWQPEWHKSGDRIGSGTFYRQ